MKIAFASEHPNHISAFSGTPCYMFQALHDACESLIYIETPGYTLETILHDPDYGMRYLQESGRYLSAQLEKLDVDVVICQGSSMIPFLQTDKPVVLWHDAIWSALMQIDFETFKERYAVLYDWDRMALERCDSIFFAADWICAQAMSQYNVPEQKIHCLPFGANIETPSLEAVETFIYNRTQNPCQLTFIAVDWVGKGLPLAYDVLRQLNESGTSAKLNVIGCHVSRINVKHWIKHYIGYQRFTHMDRFRLQFQKDPDVNKIGFLRKDKPPQYQRLCEVLQATHFLLHPASFECFGIAVVEALAFGVPVVGINRHGLTTTIRNGKNGYLFNSDEYVERASSCILEHMKNHKKYEALALRSHMEQQARLDWHQSVQKLLQILSMNGLVVHAY